MAETRSDLSDRVAEEIRAVMGRKRLSGRALALLAGIPKSTVLRWLGGQTPMSLTDLELIARALDVPVVDLFPLEERVAASVPPLPPIRPVRVAAPLAPGEIPQQVPPTPTRWYQAAA